MKDFLAHPMVIGCAYGRCWMLDVACCMLHVVGGSLVAASEKKYTSGDRTDEIEFTRLRIVCEINKKTTEQKARVPN